MFGEFVYSRVTQVKHPTGLAIFQAICARGAVPSMAQSALQSHERTKAAQSLARAKQVITFAQRGRAQL
jgi:hypothetical protein